MPCKVTKTCGKRESAAVNIAEQALIKPYTKNANSAKFAGQVHKPLGSMALREDFREFIS